MSNITISIPDELKKKMEAFPEINWSGFLKRYIESKVERLLWKESMLRKLESEKEFDEIALEIGDKIKQGVWNRLRKEGW